MIETVHFLNDDWLWPVMVAALVFWAIFIWKEYGKSFSGRFWVKVIISFIAIVALAMIALKPAVYKENDGKKVAVLTPHYRPQTLDSLREKYPDLQTTNYVAGEDFGATLDHTDFVFVIGDGIRAFDLWQLEGKAGFYLGGKPLEGSTNLNYKQQNRVGDSLKIYGFYEKPQEGNLLLLKAPGGETVDSLTLQTAAHQRFGLSANLKVKGDFLYTLEKKDSLGTILSRDEIPINVLEQKPLKILILNSAPNFETKYLKDFLGKKGQQVLVRTLVTRGKFSYEYLNMERQSLNPFSRDDLKDFDLLILDSQTLKSINKVDLKTLKKAIEEDGLGVFIQTDSDFFSSEQKLSSFRISRDRNTEAAITEFPDLKLEKLPYQFDGTFGNEPFFRKNENNSAVYQRIGNGRVGASTLQNTYALVLNGKDKEYALLWSEITEVLAKKEEPISQWELSQFPVHVDEPLHFKLRTSLENPQVKTVSGSRISLKQDPDLPYVWTGVTYPAKAGWNQLSVVQDSLSDHRFYVQDTAQFKALTIKNTIRSNRKFFRESEIKKQVTTELEPINPIGFFMIFLGCMGYLWLEPKVFG